MGDVYLCMPIQTGIVKRSVAFMIFNCGFLSSTTIYQLSLHTAKCTVTASMSMKLKHIMSYKLLKGCTQIGCIGSRGCNKGTECFLLHSGGPTHSASF